MHQNNFAHNLRALLQEYKTISEGARVAGINRQQLNKYLNGSRFPTARTLEKISKAFEVDIDDLLFRRMQPLQADRRYTKAPVRAEIEIKSAFKASNMKSLRDSEALTEYCGDYLCWHRTALSNSYIHCSLIRIYQINNKTYGKSIVALRRDGTPKRAIKVHRHHSLVFMNSGCLHLLRMSSLSGGETDLGLMIVQLPRLLNETRLSGHTLTTSIYASGKIVPSEILMQKISLPPIEAVRRYCGAWLLSSPDIDPEVKRHFPKMNAPKIM